MKTKQKIEFTKDSFEAYLGKKDHISASDIKNFLHSPCYYYFKAFEEVKNPNEAGRHFSIGSALHEIVLEPHLFFSNYLVAPKFDKRTKAGKLGHAKFLEESKGKTLLTEDEFELAVKMGESDSKNKTFVSLIRNSYREVSCYTVDEKTGLKLRMRPDFMPTNESVIVDIKTCADSSPLKFKYDAKKFGYPISAAFYSNFLKKDTYLFAAMEKEAPYQAAMYVLDDDLMDKGRKDYRMALDLLKWSFDNDYWCSYNEWEILKECYELDNLEIFFDLKDTSSQITILR